MMKNSLLSLLLDTWRNNIINFTKVGSTNQKAI